LTTDTLLGNTIQNGDFVLGDASHDMFDLIQADPVISPQTGIIITESTSMSEDVPQLYTTSISLTLRGATL
jgi:hypothetical protein